MGTRKAVSSVHLLLGHARDRALQALACSHLCCQAPWETCRVWDEKVPRGSRSGENCSKVLLFRLLNLILSSLSGFPI